MTKRLLANILLLLIIVFKGFSQNGFTIIGTVYNRSTNQPIENATVVIGSQHTLTNHLGEYQLTLKEKGKRTIFISRIGYFPKKETLQFTPTKHFNFYLKEKDNSLNEIVVTGTRTPKKIADSPVITQVITSKQIADMGNSDIRELLTREVAGLQFQEVGFGTTINFQGMGGKHILFLIDGERMAGERGNNIDYQRINLDNIERIEIVQGASSALYGSQAMGGVINIITKNAKKKFSAEATLKYTQPFDKNFTQEEVEEDEELAFYKKSVDKQNIDVSLSVGMKSKKWNSYTNLKYKTSDGYQIYDTDSLVKHFAELDTTIYERKSATPTGLSGYKNWSISQKIGYTFSKKLKTEVKGLFFRSNRYDFNADYKYSQNNNINLVTNINYEPSQKSKFTLSINADNYSRNEKFELIKNRKDETYNNTILQPRLLFHHIFNKKQNIIIGVEHTNEILSSGFFQDSVYATKKQYSTTFFAQDDWQINNNLNLTTGVRADYNNNYGLRITPKISIFQKMYPFTFRFNYANGYRSPNLKDLYMNWDHLGMFWIYGNKDLRPETNHYFSLATEYLSSKLYLMVTLYANQFKNKIVGEWNADATELHYKNQKSSLLTGGSFNSRIHLVENLTLYTSVNYLHPKTTNSVQLTAQSKWTATNRIEYKIYYKKLRTVFNFMTRYIGEKKFHTLDKIDYRGKKVEAYYLYKIPQYAVSDISLTQYIGKSFRCTLGVNNIFDYRASIINFNSYVSAGRHAFISLNYKL